MHRYTIYGTTQVGKKKKRERDVLWLKEQKAPLSAKTNIQKPTVFKFNGVV